MYYSELFWNIFTKNNKFQDAVQKVSSVFLDSPIHHTSRPYLVKTHNYKKFVICSMFYHINKKSALLMSIFRERFCNKELIKKKNSKHLADEKNLVLFLLGMMTDWTEDILRFIFNGLHFKTLFYILHIYHRVQNICIT